MFRMKWGRRHNEIIRMENGAKYNAGYDEKSNRATLVIKKIELGDMGKYILKATNEFKQENKTFVLNVTGKQYLNILY